MGFPQHQQIEGDHFAYTGISANLRRALREGGTLKVVKDPQTGPSPVEPLMWFERFWALAPGVS